MSDHWVKVFASVIVLGIIWLFVEAADNDKKKAIQIQEEKASVVCVFENTQRQDSITKGVCIFQDTDRKVDCLKWSKYRQGGLSCNWEKFNRGL